MALTNAEKTQLFKHITDTSEALDKFRKSDEEKWKKIDEIYRVLGGDQLGTFPGLIAEQKQDNDFRLSTTQKLVDISHTMEKQYKINLTVNERIEKIEQLMGILNALSKLNRSTLMVIAAAISLLALLVSKFDNLTKWMFQHLQ